MITIKNVRTLDGQTIDFHVNSTQEHSFDAKSQLLLFPGLIDPHISLGSPDRENWAFGVESAVRGGVTTILDIPTETSPSASQDELEQKKIAVDKHLADLKIPLHYFPYVQGNSQPIEELGIKKKLALGSLLLFTPDQQVLDERIWNRIFQIAAWEDIPVVINSRNENSWQQARFKSLDETLLEKSIYYAEKQNTRLYVLNIATQNEIDLIQEARSRSMLIYAETTPQHLFPQPLSHADFLLEALNSGVIETVGSGFHVEGEEQERLLWQGANFDFSNPLFLLPLLLTAYHKQKITLENIVRLTRVNVYDIFKLSRKNEDVILIDIEKEQAVQRVSKNQSTELKLKGWPEYVIVQGHLFKSTIGGYHLTHVE
jgi:dihydroorotase